MKMLRLLPLILVGFLVAVWGILTVIESSNFWECNLPIPPSGFWWKIDSMYVGASLIDSNGEQVAGVVGNRVWLFACGNTDRIFKTTSDAIGAAVNCANHYSTRSN